MNLLAYLVLALAKISHLLINLYTFVIAIAVLLSWVNPDPSNPLVRTLRQLTEPVFNWVRRILPRAWLRSSIDFSPMIVLFILILLDTILVQLLYDFSAFLSTPKTI